MPHDASRLKSSQPLAYFPLVVRAGVGNPPTALAPQCPSPHFCSQALTKFKGLIPQQ
ncbi:MAG: hypothetical protein HWQ23_30680 [Nostoc sp. JL33]|uniref:hypothetical protein n=1 Tax=Nostoc sp. JL33 TaxID=2815396 RepID=UPI0025EE794E|nr:hypothetical protein [Nostoc sp. JL33]MBN3874479.1 hypothetical protein [Nostoc sp. JL33]